MKLQKKKGPGLKLARPHFEKSALRTQAMAKGIGAAVKEAAPEEGEEEEVKGQMDFLERRAWDKLSTRKKRRFLRWGNGLEPLPSCPAGETGAAGQKEEQARPCGKRGNACRTDGAGREQRKPPHLFRKEGRGMKGGQPEREGRALPRQGRRPGTR